MDRHMSGKKLMVDLVLLIMIASCSVNYYLATFL